MEEATLAQRESDEQTLSSEMMSPESTAPATTEPACDLEQASQPYVGLWIRLVSTTNWEKGRIIAEWRDALVAAGAPVSEYADDAWGRRVGGVTGQHVGRLRRVFQRFGATYSQYAGLYWSHFQAALDWDDAEMWLEGASQSRWSVSAMRKTRWETAGGSEETRPREEEIVAAETDEDFGATAADDSSEGVGTLADVQGGPSHEGPDFGEEDETGDHSQTAYADADSHGDSDGDGEPAQALVRPFANLPDLPPDLADAFESLKLAILRHKAHDWQDIACSVVLDSLDALKALTVAPSEGF